MAGPNGGPNNRSATVGSGSTAGCTSSRPGASAPNLEGGEASPDGEIIDERSTAAPTFVP